MTHSNLQHIENRLMEIRHHKVLIDRDVAALYGVETKRINEAVKNNLDKFPSDYIIELSVSEWNDLQSKISTANFSKTRVPPKAFTEKGLYMLATILKSKQARQLSNTDKLPRRVYPATKSSLRFRDGLLSSPS